MNHQDTKFTKGSKSLRFALKRKSFLGALGDLVVKEVSL